MNTEWKKHKFNPTNEVEKILFAFYQESNKYWNDYDESYAKVKKNYSKEELKSGKAEDDFYKEWKTTHPKSKFPVPDWLALDFCYSDTHNLLHRLENGYYRVPKVYLVKTEYGITVWLLQKHEDIKEVVLGIFKYVEDEISYCVRDVPEEPEKPKFTDLEVLEKLPKAAKEKVEEVEKEAKKEYNDLMRYRNQQLKNLEFFKKAKKGDARAAAAILINCFIAGNSETKITCEIPENVRFEK